MLIYLLLCSTLLTSLQYHIILLLSCSAEVLDKHLSMVQRDHEQKSQIVERRIRDDAALEEAKRKEQAVKEEKLRQERARQEAEVCLLRFVVSHDLFFSAHNYTRFGFGGLGAFRLVHCCNIGVDLILTRVNVLSSNQFSYCPSPPPFFFSYSCHFSC